MNGNYGINKWDQIQSTAKKIWGELTDKDFKKAGGSVDKLHSIIEEKFGDSIVTIRARLNLSDMK
jgi:uncharacterized protein YjbJ (UPF0337 family)